MSNQGPLGKAKDKLKDIAKFDVEGTGEKAGIKFLNRGGFIRERFDKIEHMDNQSFIDQDGAYQTSVIPWLDVKNNSHHFEVNDAFLDIRNYYYDLCSHIDRIKKRHLDRLNRDILRENVERKKRGEKELALFTMEHMKNLIVDEELEEYKQKLELQFLKYGAQLNLSRSWDNPDDNKSLVLSKQVLVEPNPQTSEIYKMLKMAMGPQKIDPEDMSG